MQGTSSTEELAATPAVDAEPISLEGWNSEVIELPSEFAPALPTGVESLRFAPGMFDASAEDYWSYAFVLWIDEPAPNAARIEELLELYYDGLLLLVADSKDRDIGDDPAQVTVAETSPGHFEAKIDLIDSFVTFEAVELRFLVEVAQESETKSKILCQASPQAEGHAVWRSLSAAVASIEKP